MSIVDSSLDVVVDKKQCFSPVIHAWLALLGVEDPFFGSWHRRPFDQPKFAEKQHKREWINWTPAELDLIFFSSYIKRSLRQSYTLSSKGIVLHDCIKLGIW